ncbi:MAG: hypothetical protein V4653_04125 [Pseudomonadota bacterium]
MSHDPGIAAGRHAVDGSVGFPPGQLIRSTTIPAHDDEGDVAPASRAASQGGRDDTSAPRDTAGGRPDIAGPELDTPHDNGATRDEVRAAAETADTTPRETAGANNGPRDDQQATNGDTRSNAAAATGQQGAESAGPGSDKKDGAEAEDSADPRVTPAHEDNAEGNAKTSTNEGQAGSDRPPSGDDVTTGASDGTLVDAMTDGAGVPPRGNAGASNAAQGGGQGTDGDDKDHAAAGQGQAGANAQDPAAKDPSGVGNSMELRPESDHGGSDKHASEGADQGEIAATGAGVSQPVGGGPSTSTDRTEPPPGQPVLVPGHEDSATGVPLIAGKTESDSLRPIVCFRVMDAPEGAVLRAGGSVLAREPDGSILVSAADAHTLSITPPAGSDHAISLRVTAVVQEANGSRSETAHALLTVHVDDTAEAPIWLRVGAEGREDTSIPLGLDARLTDGDGSERLSFLVSGLPAGAILNAGAYHGPGSWSLTAEQAATATITPPHDFTGTMQLTVSAVAQEQDGGQQAVSTVNLPVRVTAVVDTTGWNATATGDEDSPIALNLAPPMLDQDGSERLVGTVIVQGVPEGAVLRSAEGKAFTGSGGTWKIPAEQLHGVTITMPPDSDLAVLLSVRVEVEDAGGVRAEIMGSVTVDPRGVADMPQLEVGSVKTKGHSSENSASGWTALPITAASTDPDGSEDVHVWVRDVPEGFSLSSGTPAGQGAWLLQAKDLHGLKMRSRADFDGEITLRIQAVAVEREADTQTAESRLVVAVDNGGKGGNGLAKRDDAEAPTLAVSAASGREDGSTPLFIKADTSGHGGGNQALGIRIDGLPRGARLSAGVQDGESGTWVLRPDELKDLAVIPPADFSGDFAISVTAVTVKGTGQSASTQSRVSMHFDAVLDGAIIGANPAAGVEDGTIPLNLNIAPGDRDGSETLVSVTISDLPRGAIIAPGAGIRDQGNGTWSVAPDALGNVRLVPPADAHGSFEVTVTATTREPSNGAQATTSRSVTVDVAARADAPIASAMDATGREGEPIALSLSAGLLDRDGSETLSIVVSGLPERARLSAGINNGDGSWTLTSAQLDHLTVIPQRDWSGSMPLTMQAHALERSTAEVASTRLDFHVTVAGVAQAPVVDDASVTSDAVAQPRLTLTAPLHVGRPAHLHAAVSEAEADGGRNASSLRGDVRTDPESEATHLTGSENASSRRSIAAASDHEDRSESAGRHGHVSASIRQDGGVAHGQGTHAHADASENAEQHRHDNPEARQDADIAGGHGSMMSGATITLAGGGAGDRLAFADDLVQHEDGRTMLGSTGIEILIGGDGQVTLSGLARTATYGEILEGMAVEHPGLGGLASGTRSIGITLHDDEGGKSSTNVVTLNIPSCDGTHDGPDQVLAAAAAHDVFAGSAGQEQKHPGGSSDVFAIAAEGGHHPSEGGSGSWTDDVHATSEHGSGNWTDVVDNAANVQLGEHAMDFTQPAAGHIQFADGGQLEFTQIERITW